MTRPADPVPDIAALIARLEAATEGSRELDAEIDDHVRAARLGWPVAKAASLRARVIWDQISRYSTSLDSALSLVPEGHGWDLSSNTAHNKACATHGTCGGHVHWALVSPTGYGDNHGGASPALALCIAALKARASLSPTPQS